MVRTHDLLAGQDHQPHRTRQRLQRRLGVLGNVNILTGAALVAVNAIIAQTNHSHPAAKRTSATRSIPLWLGAAATTTAAVVDTTRRARR